ncbi:hypothetical protein GCM10009872_14670 [Actinopolymorpha rutila]
MPDGSTVSRDMWGNVPVRSDIDLPRPSDEAYGRPWKSSGRECRSGRVAFVWKVTGAETDLDPFEVPAGETDQKLRRTP